MTTVHVEVPEGVSREAVERLTGRLLKNEDLMVRIMKALADSPDPVGPGVLAQLGRLEQHWRSIETRYGLLSVSDVAGLGGGDPAKRHRVSNLRRRSGLLGVSRGGALRFPGFQFKDARVRPEWAALAEPLLAAGWSEGDVLLWFAAPTGWLDGAVPADLLDSDPDGVRQVVAHAAAGCGA